ncbi:MAG: hypothetical protein H6696_16875 [Deferribacteres bacterium]|nr:hypothetical protein [candidate division KSB1 bacterium]MCB9503608.1 hypothetical protein [Deferribacteres bacterium]
MVNGQPESCLLCHAEMQGFVTGHLPVLIGCSGCHLGQPTERDKNDAHANMLLVPGNIAEAEESCGNRICHPDYAKWVPNTLMSTGRGIVSVNRFVFGESDSPDGPGHLSQLGNSPADKHLRQLCASCHLTLPKTQPSPISERSRGGGCTACHLQYSDEAKSQFQNYKETGELPTQHPQLNVQIRDENCFGCHSRSARISTSYEGWHETLLAVEDVQPDSTFRIFQDGRVFSRQAQDIHYQRGMSCIDCHTWRETMGDGTRYNHQEEQIEIVCDDCHFTGKPRTISIDSLRQHDLQVLGKRRWQSLVKTMLRLKKSGSPLLNSFIDSTGTAKLILKNSGALRDLRPPSAQCGTTIPGHNRLSCQTCHTQWAPTCIACHTEYEPQNTSFDHLQQKDVPGAWIEYADGQLPVPPTLGVQKEVIETFIPGMILTISSQEKNLGNSGGDEKIFRRMYAPIRAHTIGIKARTCESCHNNPRALGYGEGKLEFFTTYAGYGKWVFTPTYANHPEDGLPADAWIAFLQPSPSSEATRSDIRPFTIVEQQKILSVGACLTCHEGTKQNIDQIYGKYSQSLDNLSEKCLQAGF